MTLTVDEEVPVRGETGWYWRIVQTEGERDVDIDLGSMFEDWGADELQLVLHSIARKLQYVASMLLSHKLEEGEDE